MSLKVVIHGAEEGGYWAEVPALPGCVSQGETLEDLEDLEENLKEAANGYLAVLRDSLQGLQSRLMKMAGITPNEI